MIKMLDGTQYEEVTGYGFYNAFGEVETVSLVDDVFVIESAEGDRAYIYKADIEKLIKALTLAAKL